MLEGALPVECDGDGALSCPACGGPYLHHKSVSVYNREHEDGPGSCIHVYEQKTSTVPLDADSYRFMGRRDDIRIYFMCEDCPAELELVIKQHKGITYMGWI